MRLPRFPSSAIFIHRIKTSLYALSALVLIGWVTDALNEDVMFRIVVRHFFPQEVAQYVHPFDTITSTLIWGVPLLFGLLLMLVATVLTVHHLKKRHVHTINKGKRLQAMEDVFLCAPDTLVDEAIPAYTAAKRIHLIHLQEKNNALCPVPLTPGRDKSTLIPHVLQHTHDLPKPSMNLASSYKPSVPR